MQIRRSIAGWCEYLGIKVIGFSVHKRQIYLDYLFGGFGAGAACCHVQRDNSGVKLHFFPDFWDMDEETQEKVIRHEIAHAALFNWGGRTLVNSEGETGTQFVGLVNSLDGVLKRANDAKYLERVRNARSEKFKVNHLTGNFICGLLHSYRTEKIPV